LLPCCACIQTSCCIAVPASRLLVRMPPGWSMSFGQAPGDASYRLLVLVNMLAIYLTWNLAEFLVTCTLLLRCPSLYSHLPQRLMPCSLLITYSGFLCMLIPTYCGLADTHCLPLHYIPTNSAAMFQNNKR
jgi:hypothetical protein